MALSMDLSRGKLTFTLMGLQIKLLDGEKIKLTVQNGALVFFEITANGRQAIFALTEEGKRILELISRYPIIDIARCAISAFSAGCTAAEFIERARVGEAVSEVARVGEAVSEVARVGEAVSEVAKNAVTASATVADDVAQTAVGAGMSAGVTAGRVITAIGGGVGIFMGILDVGVGVNNIFNGTATVNQLKEAKESIVTAAQRGDLDSGKRDVLENAKKMIIQLVADAETHSGRTNGAKIGGGIASTIGGGMAIAGIAAFPPLAIPGIITSVGGAILNIGATYKAWTANHEQRLEELNNLLQEDGIFILNRE